jgi:glycerophosphoryl diester phosphodiesterase
MAMKYTLLLACFVTLNTHAQHVLKIASPKQLQQFFKYTGNDIPLISAHRGGADIGYPENCIETFAHTLAATPATFEVDPRLTKDSVIVLLHDATLDRTTTGKGKLKDYTWEEIKQLKLKDINGYVTEYRIPTLKEAIEWARGKTVLMLDKKDVPFAMTAKLIKEMKAEAWVMVQVHNAEEAKFYYNDNNAISFEAHILSEKAMREYEAARIPWSHLFAYVGPQLKPENKRLYDQLHQRGVTCMVATAPIYDKLKTAEERAVAYRTLIENDADMIESDRPIEVAAAIQSLKTKKSKKKKFFGIQ